LHIFLGDVNELRDMHLKVPSSHFKILFEEIMSYQPEPMERQLALRKSKSEAMQLYAEKKIKQRDNILFPRCKLQIHEISCAYSFWVS